MTTGTSGGDGLWERRRSTGSPRRESGSWGTALPSVPENLTAARERKQARSFLGRRRGGFAGAPITRAPKRKQRVGEQRVGDSGRVSRDSEAGLERGGTRPQQLTGPRTELPPEPVSTARAFKGPFSPRRQQLHRNTAKAAHCILVFLEAVRPLETERLGEK